MSQATAPAARAASHQHQNAEPEAQQDQAAPETGAPATWGGLARGGVAAPPLPPPGLLGGGPRGLRQAGADYVLQLQRVHGNLQTARSIALDRQTTANRPATGDGPVDLAAAPEVADTPTTGAASSADAHRPGVETNGHANERIPSPAALDRAGAAGGDGWEVARTMQPGAAGGADEPRVQRGIWDRIASGAKAVGGAISSGVRSVGSAVASGASFLFEQALRLAGVPADLLAILRRAGSAFDQVVSNPMGFLSNLLGAVMGGFRQFASNIGTHIVGGLIRWLTGALGGAGLRLPQRFDLAGIFDLALQILGLTADRIRQKIGRVIGEQNVRRIEAVWNVVSNLIQNGLGGLWNMAREFLGNLQEMVLGPVKEWAITRIIQQGVLYVVSLFNPAGAIVQAIRMIWNVIQFLRSRGGVLLGIFRTVLEAIAAIATGNIGGAVSAIERTLARAIPAVLDLLARLLGLGDVASPIRRAIDAIRQPIDRAIDRVIGGIARGIRGIASRIGGALSGRGRAGQAAAAETQAAQERRLREGVQAGAGAFNRFSGRPVGEQILRPLLTGIRLRYRLGVLEPVVQGDKWAVHGELRRMTVPTGVSAPTLTLPVNLSQHENVAGPGQGHVLAKHVGKDQTYLRNRLKNQPNIPAATTFRTQAAATAMVNLVLEQNRQAVTTWMSSPSSKRAFDVADAGIPSGHGVKRPAANPHDPAAIDAEPLSSFKGVRVVLKKGGPNGWYVLTAHPL